MNLLIEDAEEFTDFLIDHNLTADQFLFCILLSSESDGYYGLPDRQEAVSKFYKYFNTVAKHKENPVWSQQDLDDLIDKGFICRRTGIDEDSYQYDHFEVEEKFLDLVFQKKGSLMDRFDEFWNEYPARYQSDEGKSFNIKAVNKEEIFEIYKDALDEDEHETILSALKVAKSKNEVDCRIDKWLTGHQWKGYIDEIDDGANENIQQTVL